MKTKRSKAKIRVGHKRRSAICSKPEQKLEVLRPDAAGIDCGAEEHYIAVPPDRVAAGEPTVRCFSAFTEGLEAAVDWLKACRITTVAMESTGVYWIALHQKLEAAGIEVYLVNARHVRNVPGRKTDVQDSQWLRQLHRFGLLNASFRPQDIVCRLRSLHRHRDNLVSSSGSEIQHMQKALQQMNLHLHHVVSDITGLTGLSIIDAILSGQRDPEQLVKLRDKRVYKSTPRQMQAALVGDYRAEHLFVLSQSLQAYRFYQARIEECDREIEPLLEKLALQVEAASAKLELGALKPAGAEDGAMTPELSNESKPGYGLKAKRKRKPTANEPKIDLAGLLERICGIDLTKVVGLNVLNVLLIVSEIGVDMSKWRSAKAFCSWLGLCPGNKISGGKVLDSRTRQVVNRVADALRLAAQSVGRTETCLGIFYRRKLAHLGAPKATTATARKLACLIYHLLKYKQPYQEPDSAIYQLRLQKSTLAKLQRQATALGYTLQPTAPPPV
jgi:Transposase IS116/IS110/IS902 family./Transposase.